MLLAPNHCRLPLLASLLVAALAAGAADTGTIVGRVDPPSRGAAVGVLRRDTGAYARGAFDGTNGAFRIGNLPLDVAYDVVIEASQPTVRLEGVNLHVPASDYEEEQPLSPEDRDTLQKKVLALNTFEDHTDVLTITGNVQHAVVLVKKLRTTPFVNSKPGEVIWRAEIWHFERPETTWAKVQDELFVVLYRERIQRNAFEKRAITFDPRLGGVRLTAAAPRADLGVIALPDTPPGIRFRSE